MGFVGLRGPLWCIVFLVNFIRYYPWPLVEKWAMALVNAYPSPARTRSQERANGDSALLAKDLRKMTDNKMRIQSERNRLQMEVDRLAGQLGKAELPQRAPNPAQRSKSIPQRRTGTERLSRQS